MSITQTIAAEGGSQLFVQDAFPPKKYAKAVDPRDDVSGPEFKEDLEFFSRYGYKNLMRALLKQAVRDLVDTNQNKDIAPEVQASALWPKSEAGRSTIEFLMPGVSVDLIVANLYEDPALFLSRMTAAEETTPMDASALRHESAGVALDHDVIASAFGEKPTVHEQDLPLSLGESHFDECPSGELGDMTNSPVPSWG